MPFEASFLSVVALLLAFLAVFRPPKGLSRGPEWQVGTRAGRETQLPSPLVAEEFSGVSYKRREGPIPKALWLKQAPESSEVPQDVWDEARAQFRVRLREIEVAFSSFLEFVDLRS